MNLIPRGIASLDGMWDPVLLGIHYNLLMLSELGGKHSPRALGEPPSL